MKTIREPARDLPILREADVVVVGGGPTGICAAVSAARNGARTVLVERHGFLGGNLVMWLPLFTYYDVDGNRIIKGIPQEFAERMEALGGASPHYRSELFNGYTIADAEMVKLVAQQMVLEAGVEVLLHAFFAGVVMDGDRIAAVVVESKSGRQAIVGRAYVDCSGDGDLAAAAGAPWEKGDAHGRLQPPTLMVTVRGVDVEAARMAALDGSAEHHVFPLSEEQVASNERLILVGMEELTELARARGEWDVPRRRVCFISTLEDDVVAVNMTRVLGVDATDADDLTRGELEARAQTDQVVRLLRKYVPGFENAELDLTAPMLGVRETRRILGDYVLTGGDVLEGERFADEVLLGGYHVDIHSPVDGTTVNLVPEGAYGIPYRCLLPRGVGNLLVGGRCISATHEGQAATRVMVTCMAMGEAAGCAAAMAVAGSITPREVDTDALRDRLRAQGACLDV
jgi:hypothetical protein